MIVGDSKSFATAAFYGTPLLRISRFASGAWLRAYHDLHSFVADLAAGKAVAAAREDAMVWFAHYLSAEAFAPREAEVTGTEIVERLSGALRPTGWSEGFARVMRLQRRSAGSPVSYTHLTLPTIYSV